MNSILNGTGQLVALLLICLNLALHAILGALVLLAGILGLVLLWGIFLGELGIKSALSWGQR